MTPKETAKSLFDEYQIAGSQYYVDVTKKYALITVNEIKITLSDLCCEFGGNDIIEEYIHFWEQVKNEIEKL
jgi:hypothetical protein